MEVFFVFLRRIYLYGYLLVGLAFKDVNQMELDCKKLCDY